MKKIAIQIYLDPDQDRVLGHLSKTQQRSKAAIIRACLQDYFEKLPSDEDPILNIIGLGDSGHTDLSEKHDEYLTQLGDQADGSGVCRYGSLVGPGGQVGRPP